MTGPDAVAAETWRLAEEFDRDARTEADPGPLAAALDAEMDADVLFTLLEELHGLCLGDDEATARRYGDHLVALARRLGDDEARRMLIAGVDMFVAELCGYAGRWEEAVARVTRASDDVTRLLPGLLGDRDAVLAGHADHEGRDADALALWSGAHDRYAEAERWADAAMAAEVAAERGGVATTEAFGRWRRAAELFAIAEQPDRATACVEQACGRLGALMQTMQSGDELAAMALAEDARRLATEHGLGALAADLGALAALMAAESDDPWDVLAARFERRRADYRALGGNPAKLREQLASIDMYAGTAAVSRNRPAEAEQLLVRALEVFRDTDQTWMVQSCESQLVALLNSTRPAGSSFAIPDGHGTWTDPEILAGVRMLRALELAGRRELPAAVAELAEASRLARSGGAAHKAAGFDALGAYLALVGGDRRAGQRGAERIDAFLADGAGRIPRAGVVMLTGIAGMLRSELARTAGDIDGQLASLTRTERALHAADARLLAAQVALQQGRALLAAGRPAEALATGLPAALALDAMRCALPDAARRGSHATSIAHAFDTAYRAAAAVGDTRALAELIEVSRGNAIPLPRATADHDDAVSALAPIMAPPPAPAVTDRLFGAQSAAGGEERTALGLAAWIRTPWETLALVGHLARAERYLDPVRAEITVDWRVREVRP